MNDTGGVTVADVDDQSLFAAPCGRSGGGSALTGDLEAAILTLLAEAGGGRSVTPEQVARLTAGEDWRSALAQVRATAVGLARQGRLVILRHGKPVDPDSFKGVYRLGSPDASA